jgi:hypothetical protein
MPPSFLKESFFFLLFFFYFFFVVFNLFLVIFNFFIRCKIELALVPSQCLGDIYIYVE